MRVRPALVILMAGAALVALRGWGQVSTRPAMHPGSAVVVSGTDEYTIRILCDDASRPERGFSTEPNRVTRAETGGRINGVNLRLRPWKDSGDVLISLDGAGQAWVPRPPSAGGLLEVGVALRPVTYLKDGVPTLVSYEMWKAGDVPPDEQQVSFKANCTTRDPAAPAYRKRSD